MEIERKGLVELKQLDDGGRGLARIATLSAVDSDGDTYTPGAFGEQDAHILPAHNWLSVPLGKARVFEDGGQALAELRFNLDTSAGRDWHSALKFDLADERPLQEWSFGFEVLDSVKETRDGEPVRVLRRLAVHEVSPVVRGAGVGTATLALKHGLPFREQIDATAAAVSDCAARALEVAALREANGRVLSEERLGQLADLKAAMDSLGDELLTASQEIDALLRGDSTDADARKEAGRLAAEFELRRSRLKAKSK